MKFSLNSHYLNLGLSTIDQSLTTSTTPESESIPSAQHPPQTPVRVPQSNINFQQEIVHELDNSGVYQSSDSTFHAFVNDSPKSQAARREKTQVDLRLPPLAVFSGPGKWS